MGGDGVTVISFLSGARRLSDRLALPVLAGGLVLVMAQDARARAIDRRLAEQVRSRDGLLVSRRSSVPEVTVLVAAWNEACAAGSEAQARKIIASTTAM